MLLTLNKPFRIRSFHIDHRVRLFARQAMAPLCWLAQEAPFRPASWRWQGTNAGGQVSGWFLILIELSSVDWLVLNLFVNRELAKRPAKFLTNSSESKLVIGDKTGDVYLMDLKVENLEQSQPQLLMGHMSMLTDMVRPYCVTRNLWWQLFSF